MNFEVLTLFPRSLEPIFESSILGRASAKGIISINCTDIRDYTKDKHRRVDDAPYGGGYGMVMMCQPVVDCIRDVKSRLSGSTRVIYMSPQGGLFDQKKAEELSKYDKDLSNLENRINDVLLMCCHLGSMWKQADILTAQKLQNLLFPNGIYWDKEIDGYRTITENTGLAVIRKITESYEKEKEENPCGNSSLVNSCARGDSNPHIRRY